MTIILQNSRQKHCIPQCAVASIRKGKSDVIWDNPQRFNLCSISKFITALLVLKAIQDGHAALNTPVKRILPIFSNPAITLHQLLTHTSGIKDNPYFDGHLRASDERILSISAPFEPGTFNYSDQGYMILQIILEKCYHLGFEEIASASLFEPLHLRSMAYINHPDDLNDKEYIRGTHPDLSLVDQDLTIYPFPAASGLWCTLADFTLFIQALLKGWHNEGSFPIQASFLRQLGFQPSAEGVLRKPPREVWKYPVSAGVKASNPCLPSIQRPRMRLSSSPITTQASINGMAFAVTFIMTG